MTRPHFSKIADEGTDWASRMLDQRREDIAEMLGPSVTDTDIVMEISSLAALAFRICLCRKWKWRSRWNDLTSHDGKRRKGLE